MLDGWLNSRPTASHSLELFERSIELASHLYVRRNIAAICLYAPVSIWYFVSRGSMDDFLIFLHLTNHLYRFFWRYIGRLRHLVVIWRLRIYERDK